MIHEDGDVLGRGFSQRSVVPTRLRWSAFASCLVLAGCGAAPDATTSGGKHLAQTRQALPAAPDASLFVLNKCVDVPGWSNTDGTNIQIYDCTGNNNQQWVLPGDGTVRPAFNMAKCLDLPGWQTNNGTPIQMYDCNGGDNQQWTLGVDGALTGFGGKCVDVPGFDTSNGTILQYYDCNGGDNQRFVSASAMSEPEMELARAWAPIHYMDISPDGDHSLSGQADFVVPYDYDHDENSHNNWDNLGAGWPLFGAAYAAVSESSSHYFIYYTFYHPRDWTNNTFGGDEHENDMEGLVMLVRKDGSQFGSLDAVITTEDDWHTYTANPRVVGGETITTESWGGRQHPMTYQVYEGHGIRGCTSPNCGRSSTDDVIKYRPIDPSQPSEIPPVPVPRLITPVGYHLLDMRSMMLAHRFDKPTFISPSTLGGDASGGCEGGIGASCTLDSANGIWSFKPDFGPSGTNNGTGEDPATVFNALFRFTGGLTPPTGDYLTNKFLHQKCDAGLRPMRGSDDPCVQQICGRDSFCCDNSWDTQCSNEVSDYCGLTCGNCNANICQPQSGPIGTGCDGLCAASICEADSYCCNTAWDSTCVSEVGTICGLNCNGL
jgi:ricin-type beta-trefoil lectin protein